MNAMRRMLSSYLSLGAIIGALPNSIQNGQQVDANPVMADLNFIVSQVNANVPGLIPSLGTLTTFTPTVLFGGVNVGMTFFAQTGFYINLGGFVFFQFRVSINALGASVGQATLAGLPIAVNATLPALGSFGGLMITSGIRFSGGVAGTIPAWTSNPGTTTCNLITLTTSAGITNLQTADFSGGCAISGSGFYFT